MAMYRTASRSIRPVRSALLVSAVFVVALFAAHALSGSPASAQTQAAPPQNLKQRFETVDLNHDGKLDRDEFYRAAVDSFYFRDKDKKGYLTIEDLREASPEAFKAANRKGDGRLSLQEYINALFIDFDKADTDKDGTLSYEEIEVYSRTNPR